MDRPHYDIPGNYVEITAGALQPTYFVINRSVNGTVYVRPVNDPTQEGALYIDPNTNNWAVQGSDKNYRIVFFQRTGDEQVPVELLPGYDILRNMSVDGKILSIPAILSAEDYQDLVFLDGETITDWSFLDTPAVRTTSPIVITLDFKRENGPVDGPTYRNMQFAIPRDGIITVKQIFDEILAFSDELNDRIPDTELETSEVESVRHTIGDQFLVTYFEP